MFNNRISYIKSLVKIQVTKFFEKELYYLEKRKLKKLLKNKDKLVLIYTIGKVGSSSVYDSLKASSKVNMPVFHIHALNPDRIEAQKQYYRNSKRGAIPFHLIQSTVLSELLPTFAGKVYLISLVREPVQRELSSLFQDSFNFTNSKNPVNSDMEEVVKGKMEELLQRLPEDEWFTNELQHVFGFNVYQMPFDPSKGYWVEQDKENNVDLAFVRLENLRTCFSEAMRELFELNDSLQLLDANVSDTKFYNEAYQETKSTIKLSKAELNALIDSTFIQKFYSDHIETLSKRWLE